MIKDLRRPKEWVRGEGGRREGGWRRGGGREGGRDGVEKGEGEGVRSRSLP